VSRTRVRPLGSLAMLATLESLAMLATLESLAMLALLAPSVKAVESRAPLESTHALAEGLRRGGRAEVTLAWTVPGPAGGAPVRMRGALALEPPDLARLDVAGSGERITLRADGGEWLQPALHQLVRLEPRHSVAAMRWWRLLAGGGGASERRLGPRRYRLLVKAEHEAETDSADVVLDSRGLPSRLELDDGSPTRQVYVLAGWRFTRARGSATFRLTPPKGVETVEMP